MKYNLRNKEKYKIELIFILLHYNVSFSCYKILFFFILSRKKLKLFVNKIILL